MDTLNNDLPKTKFSRTRVAGMATAKASLKKAAFLSKKPFLSQTQQLTAELKNNEEIAALLFKCIGQMKGTALKLAQMLSMQMDFLPEEVRQELEKSASKAPGLNRALIRKTITTQLGKPPEELFKHFESTPFAAASLGQVHRAVTHGNEEVAVKVQYPGIATSIKSDIQLAKMLIRPTKFWKIFSDVFDEIEKKLAEELDYKIEAKNTDWFYSNSSSRKYVIPRVYPELSNDKIITTSMIEGVHLDAWLSKNPDQEMKNHYGQLLVDFYEESLYLKSTLQADPNIGNYLFRQDGKLGLIDFGCTKAINKNDLDTIKKIFTSKESEEFKSPSFLARVYKSSGVTFSPPFDDSELSEVLGSWVQWNSLLAREKIIHYSSSETSPGHWDMGMSLFKNVFPFIESMSEDTIYFMRAIQGLHQILHRLGADVSFTHHQELAGQGS